MRKSHSIRPMHRLRNQINITTHDWLCTALLTTCFFICISNTQIRHWLIGIALPRHTCMSLSDGERNFYCQNLRGNFDWYTLDKSCDTWVFWRRTFSVNSIVEQDQINNTITKHYRSSFVNSFITVSSIHCIVLFTFLIVITSVTYFGTTDKSFSFLSLCHK